MPLLGDHSGGVPPVPIPNSEVKPSCADGTARETVWESRSSPSYFLTAIAGQCDHETLLKKELDAVAVVVYS